MMISDIDEETIDFDWFAIDDDGLVAHFATGGRGGMPSSVTASAENLSTVTEYFQNKVAPVQVACLSTAIALYKEFESDAEERRYVKWFVNMASRGVYSFDVIPSTVRPAGYFRVADPEIPLCKDALPENIRTILERTHFKGISFRKSDVIPLSAIAAAGTE